MDSQTRQRIFEEIKGYMAQGTTRLAPREMAYPAKAYYDPDHFGREKRLMAGLPMIVGHADELKQPGDYFARELLGIPFIVARQKDGSIRAYRNVCSHRGARICDEPHGNARQFICPYHAWNFGIDGSLKAFPRAAFPQLDAERSGLPALSVAEGLGLIWVRLDGTGPIDLDAHLGPIKDEIRLLGIEDVVLHRAEVLDADINWKSVLDGFLEIYHFASLHGASIAPYFYGTHSPFDGFGNNGRLVGVRKSFDSIADKRFEDVDILLHIAINYQICPNTILVWQGDHFEVWTSFPGDHPGHCRVLVQMLIPRGRYGDETVPRWKRNWQIMTDTVIGEDWAISKVVQGTLPHIANDQVIFGANEPGLQHFHTMMADMLRGVN